MTSEQHASIRRSFARLQPASAAAGAQFYARLFEREPALRRLFGGDIEVQGHRLMSMIAAAVALLDHPGRLDRALHELGERHVGYGVTAAHYDAVGAALLDTLAATLGEGFDDDTRAAWAALYGHVAATMRAGAAAAA